MIAMASCHFPDSLAPRNQLGQPRFFFNAITITVSTFTPTFSSTPTCWVLTNPAPAMAVSCTNVRRRRGLVIEDEEESETDDIAAAAATER